jgi:hypothetical protein
MLGPFTGTLVMSCAAVHALREEFFGHLMEAALQSELCEKHLVGTIVISVERCP